MCIRDSASAAATAARWSVLVATGLAFLAVLLLGQWVARGIVRSVRSVRESLEAMGRGDLTTPAEVASEDEIGQMARAAEATRENTRGVIESVKAVATLVNDESGELHALAENCLLYTSCSVSQAARLSERVTISAKVNFSSEPSSSTIHRAVLSLPRA